MAKVGRPRNFETPADLWQAFLKYEEWIKENPIRKMVFVGKDGARDYELINRPYSMEGFEVFCWDEYGQVEQYFKNTENRYDEFIPVCSRVKKLIREQQISGGMAGVYNASITQRLNGLTEKTENNTTLSGKIEITLDLGE
jgi:hypothetical protein